MPLPMAVPTKNARRRVCSLHISYLLAGGDYAAGKDNKGKVQKLVTGAIFIVRQMQENF